MNERIAELERRNQTLEDDLHYYNFAVDRAEAAEARCEVLEAALRECIDWIDRPGYTEGDAATSSMARAALTQEKSS